MAFTVVTNSHDVNGNTNLESLRSTCSTYWLMLTPPSFWSPYWLPFYQAWGRFQWVKHEPRRETNQNENQLKERKKQPHPNLTCLLSQMLSMVRAPVSDCGVDFHLPSLRSPHLPMGAPPSHPLSAYRRRPASAALEVFLLFFSFFRK